MAETDCAASTDKFKLHDWRWLGWPLGNPSSSGRWCRLCGLVQGEPDGQCRTESCLEYTAGGNDYCEACRQNRTITAARSDLARKVLEVVDLQRVTDVAHCCDKTITDTVLPALRELFAKEGIDVTNKVLP